MAKSASWGQRRFQQFDLFFVEALASMMLIVILVPKQVLPALNSKNDMDVNLCVGVGHDMPLLRSLPQSGSR